jgi:hypothetical protein
MLAVAGYLRDPNADNLRRYCDGRSLMRRKGAAHARAGGRRLMKRHAIRSNLVEPDLRVLRRFRGMGVRLRQRRAGELASPPNTSGRLPTRPSQTDLSRPSMNSPMLSTGDAQSSPTIRPSSKPTPAFTGASRMNQAESVSQTQLSAKDDFSTRLRISVTKRARVTLN